MLQTLHLKTTHTCGESKAPEEPEDEGADLPEEDGAEAPEEPEDDELPVDAGPLFDADPHDDQIPRDERDEWLEAIRVQAEMRLDEASRLVFDTSASPEVSVGSIELVSAWGSRKDPSMAIHCKLHGCKRILLEASSEQRALTGMVSGRSRSSSRRSRPWCSSRLISFRA